MLMNNYSRADVGFIKGKGAVLWDKNGKDYIDFASGIGVCALGHSHKGVAKIVAKQAKTLLHTSNLYNIAPQAKLANKISNLLGGGYELFFANSGAEANECAIKLARKFGFSKGRKSEIISLKNSFHGRTIATLAMTGQDKFHPDEFGAYPDGFKFYDSIDDIIANLNENTTAVIIELVQGEGGINPLDKDKVQNLAKILNQKDILLITDEVQCGVYRTGEFVTSKLYDITPDIITFAKGLGNGVPISACATRKSIFSPGDHGSTFGGGFLVTAVSEYVLDRLNELKNSGKLEKIIAKFEKKIDKLIEENSDIFLKRVGLGLMQGVVLKDPNLLSQIVSKALENGVLVLRSGDRTLRFLPPLNVSKKEMKEGFMRLKKAISEINK
ncbi:aminotransferase class III-fold pyridoxal phosphate-dependent enzyme [Campylobacter lanienae]|uniref:Aminotransferase class III-fold pyridoxal phosphate-dependent enzyme n=2 Tax=Campylobacter lanienae TaxID=75658 RepID=A0ABY3GAK4_9BACT|nr:aminotransferase class III-fold pyridoxal phosphate-dependent enzyme [Campylobacter lanienae]TWO15348.1 aminotransferase class III-fold pyridoxal phosphate-dependent enzyme [Campylobacter lanienae]TWO30122.1 aminotransferase class III-fold pyridoxal phosphate-dependent enzyme [Campylobacter lanienae]